MASYRYIHTTFWEDTKVLDDMTPEDRYFMLYLLTNPHTNQLGCYEISIRQIVNETGYNKDTIEKLLNRFENSLKVIKYSSENKEIILLNWYKYNWTKSPKVKTFILNQLKNIKTKEFIDYFNTISIPYIYPIYMSSEKKRKEMKEKEITTNENDIDDFEITNDSIDKPDDENNIFSLVEQEFGRLLSPAEYELINVWLENNNIEIIKLALKEAATRNSRSVKYIDRILYNWKQNNLKTIEEINKHNEEFINKSKSKQKESEVSPYGVYLN